MTFTFWTCLPLFTPKSPILIGVLWGPHMSDGLLLYSNRWLIALIVCEFSQFNSEGDLMSPVSTLMEREASHCSFHMLPNPCQKWGLSRPQTSFLLCTSPYRWNSFPDCYFNLIKNIPQSNSPLTPPYTHPGWQIPSGDLPHFQIMSVSDNGSEEIMQASGYFVCLFICCFWICGDFHLCRLVTE